MASADRHWRVGATLACAAATLLLATQGAAWAQNQTANQAGGGTAMCTADAAGATAGDCGGFARQLELVREAGSEADAQVQAAPDAGTVEESDLRIPLKAVRFTGASAVDPVVLQALAQPYIGQSVRLAQLQELAAEVTRHYQTQGWFLAQALVPVQAIRNGEVEISVIEGRLGTVTLNIAGDVPIAPERLRALTAPLAEGQPLRQHVYERVMLLLSDQPGVRVSSGLQSGRAAGTTDLVIDVVADQRVIFALDADNHGVRESGRIRAGATLRVASLLRRGDNLDARLLVAQGNALNYGRLAWEMPIGGNGLRVGAGIGQSRYDLGGAFAILGAQGVARATDVSLNYPLMRQRSQNLFLRASAGVKQLRDEMDALDFTTRKRIGHASIGWSWERRDGFWHGGYWASSGTLYHGRLALRDDISRAWDAPPAGRNTEGSFTKLTWQLSRLQAVAPRHLLYASATGQFTSRNLDAAEKIALGGPRAVRAYASGEVLADEGVVASLEWRWAASDTLTPFVFFDAARGRLAHAPTAFDGDVHRSLRGAGLGLVWARPRDFSLGSTLAWRVNSRPGLTDGGDRNPRLYLQLQKVF